MSFTYRRKQRQTGKGVGGYLVKYIHADEDSAKNMTSDVIQGNSLNEEPPSTPEKPVVRKRKAPPVMKPDMKKQAKYIKTIYK